MEFLTKSSFIQQKSGIPMTLDQKTSGSTPDGAAVKSLIIKCSQAFYILTCFSVESFYLI